MQQIADWLEKLGMSEYAQRFAENGIDFGVLPDLTDQDLKDIGVLLGHRRKLLRAIAEHQNLVSAESNRAFVLMQFFGYLRRNPNDPPDTNYTGYDFWLTKLNQFNGNFQSAEMVKAFITSIEYRQRFGP